MSAAGRVWRAQSEDHGRPYVEVYDPDTGEPVAAEPIQERDSE